VLTPSTVGDNPPYHITHGYDEDTDGFDDVKFDFRLDQMFSSANLVNPSKTLRVWGYTRNRRPFHGEQTVTVVP
jgi:hypothetical protein